MNVGAQGNAVFERSDFTFKVTKMINSSRASTDTSVSPTTPRVNSATSSRCMPRKTNTPSPPMPSSICRPGSTAPCAISIATSAMPDMSAMCSRRASSNRPTASPTRRTSTPHSSPNSPRATSAPPSTVANRREC